MIRKIPSDTPYFHFYNANPKGIRAGDCVIRAICTATDMSWEQTCRNLTEVGISLSRVVNEMDTYDTYLKRIGWVRMPCPKKANSNCRYTGKELAKLLQKNKAQYNLVANIGSGHTVCFKEGKVWDIWNSTEGSVGVVWVPAANVNHFKSIFN